VSTVGGRGEPRPIAGPGPLTGAVHAYWRSLFPADGVLPGRRHVDPVDLAAAAPGCLPHIWMLDVERSPWRFRYRLVGGALAAAGAGVRVGDYLEQFETDGSVSRTLVRVCTDREPHFRRGPPGLRHPLGAGDLDAVVLPLAADGRTVDVLLCCTVYHWQPGFGPTDGLSV
jgi:hypothetical protein